jgi:hypothetical protein
MALNHTQAREWLELAADGLLDAARQSQLDAHLAGCPECQAYAAELAALEGLLGETLQTRWGQPKLPKKFEQELTKKHGGPTAPAGGAPWLPLLGGLGLLALLAALLWGRLPAAGSEVTATATLAAVATQTPSATSSPTLTETATPAPLVLVAVPSQNANCREGNSNGFDIADTLFEGVEYTPIARGRDNLWVQFLGPVNGVKCWVYIVNLSLLINGELVAIQDVPESLLPFVAYPPTPTPSPTPTFTPEPLVVQTTTVPECSDGADNDKDGRIDYPRDSSCVDANDNDESK